MNSSDDGSGAIDAALTCLHKRQAIEDIYVDIFTSSAVQDPMPFPAVPEPVLGWIASGSALVEVRPFGGAWTEVQVNQGDFCLTASTVPIELRWRSTSSAPLTVMHVYIGLPLFSRMVRSTTGRPVDEFALRDVTGETDVVLCSMLESVYTAFTGDQVPHGSFVQGVAQALTAHLIQHYELVEARRRIVRGGLPAHKLHRVIDAMRAGLTQPFELGAYADLAGLSPFHFSRVFKQATGFAPSRYMARLRVEEARRLLRETGRTVLDTGTQLGYRSPSHFTQVFREHTGITPSMYRRSNL